MSDTPMVYFLIHWNLALKNSPGDGMMEIVLETEDLLEIQGVMKYMIEHGMCPAESLSVSSRQHAFGDGDYE